MRIVLWLHRSVSNFNELVRSNLPCYDFRLTPPFLAVAGPMVLVVAQIVFQLHDDDIGCCSDRVQIA